MYFGVFWCILMYFDVFWCILVYFDVFFVYFDVFWCILVYFDVFFVYFDVFWCILMYFVLFCKLPALYNVDDNQWADMFWSLWPSFERQPCYMLRGLRVLMKPTLKALVPDGFLQHCHCLSAWALGSSHWFIDAVQIRLGVSTHELMVNLGKRHRNASIMSRPKWRFDMYICIYIHIHVDISRNI